MLCGGGLRTLEMSMGGGFGNPPLRFTGIRIQEG